LFCSFGGALSVRAKGFDAPIALGVGYGRDVKAVLSAHLGKRGSNELIADTVLLGNIHSGDHLHVSVPEGEENNFDVVSHRRRNTKFWLVLADPSQPEFDFFDKPTLVGGLAIKTRVSRRIYGSLVFSWRSERGPLLWRIADEITGERAVAAEYRR